MKVVLDIETVQAPREEWARIAGLSPASEPGAAGSDDLFVRAEADQLRQAEDEQYEKSSFDGTFSRIVCIGMIMLTDSLDAHGAVSWYGANEKGILQQFWAKLGQIRPSLYVTIPSTEVTRRRRVRAGELSDRCAVANA